MQSHRTTPNDVPAGSFQTYDVDNLVMPTNKRTGLSHDVWNTMKSSKGRVSRSVDVTACLAIVIYGGGPFQYLENLW